MSGGIAYVLDLEPLRVNPDMVDVEPLNDSDREFLIDTLRTHAEETGSMVAATLLSQGQEALNRISKVMPRDYKRVLEAIALAEAEGVDPMSRVMGAV